MNELNGLKAYVIYLSSDALRLAPVRQMLTGKGCAVRYNVLPDDAAAVTESSKQRVLTPNIQWSDVLVVLIPRNNKDHAIIAWAIALALKLHKRVVGIWDEEDEEGMLPRSLDDYADAIVPADEELVLGAVGGVVDGIHEPAGGLPPDRDIKRHKC